MKNSKSFLLLLSFFMLSIGAIQGQSKRFVEKQKSIAKDMVEKRHKSTQVMVDKVFSFAELGFHEVESSSYLTSILEEAGFEIMYGISNIPTAWFAKWSNGKGPTIAL